MISLLQLINFRSKKGRSFSILVDFQQIYVRNVLLFCTGLSMARILFGQNIICLVTERSVSQNFVDTKCYINGTMTRNATATEVVSTMYHDYYQWVSVYLLLLAFGFYFPYSIWLMWFGHYSRHIESLADKPVEAIQVIKDSKGSLIYFKTWGLELFYAAYLVLILYATDVFFNNLWSRFYWSWKAIYIIFPDSGTCFVSYFQSSGTTDAKFNCLLPLCSVYRKVFWTLYGIILILILWNLLMIFYRIKELWQRQGMVNVWWAFKIAKQSTISWSNKAKFDASLKKMLYASTENLISLSVIPSIEDKYN